MQSILSSDFTSGSGDISIEHWRNEVNNFYLSKPMNKPSNFCTACHTNVLGAMSLFSYECAIWNYTHFHD